MFNNFLFHRIDNSQIVIFRIFFGLLMVAECWGAIATGWVTETFVEPTFTFTFIGFEWTQFLLGETMYYYFFILGILGAMIALGALYRFSSVLFALGWSLVYFMQKEHYNNHYYLVMLVAWFMVFIPAHRYKSIDLIFRPQIRSDYTFYWNRLLFIVQLFLVYVFAAIAKLYPGWMNGDFMRIRYQKTAIWFDEKVGWAPLTEFLYSKDFAQIISWIGFGFDLLIVPMLLWKRTRTIAFIFALIFHLINSITLHIGIFPYFALAMVIFFYPPETIRNIFFPRKTTYLPGSNDFQPRHKNQTVFSLIFVFFILWQTYLPLRHWLIPGDVLWTEEGHRLSWRMMLRTKSAHAYFYIVDHGTGERTPVNLRDYLTNLQISRISTHPDMIWQFAQYLRKENAKIGKDIGVFVECNLSINRGPYHPYIDKNVDLTQVKWKYFGHQTWLLPEPDSYAHPYNYQEFRR